MASESPYNRHGRSVDGDRAPRRYTLNASPRESLLQIAHRELGEWRDWREIARANGIIDPVIPHGFEHDVDQHFIVPFELIDGTGMTEEDLTHDLGQGFSLHAATPELQGRGAIVVSDVAMGEYQMQFQAPGDAAPGVPERITDADFFGVDQNEVLRRVRLASVGARYLIEVSLSIDAWLIFWLMRETPIHFRPTAARTELLIPEPALDQGRR